MFGSSNRGPEAFPLSIWNFSLVFLSLPVFLVRLCKLNDQDNTNELVSSRLKAGDSQRRLTS
jgi:hypothetical protein